MLLSEELSIITTADGSKTVYHPVIKENYHSRNGAVQESNHVFLNSGLRYYLADKLVDEVSVLEVGFGTGLNFLLTNDFCTGKEITLDYVGIEAFPLSIDFIAQADYQQLVSENTWDIFANNYDKALIKSVMLNDYCSLHIACIDAKIYQSNLLFDVIYFDAFASTNQPELWTKDFITHIVSFLKPGGVFVTYAITGDLKRIMKALGMKIEKAPGAAGKREMLRAIKPV
jgi:tRNA U34 5-methylaminomethyl-2-thiouridine-forming methyltransferase MnmC